MKQALLKLYAKIRKCMNPVKMPISTEWEIYKNLSMSAFSKRINSFPYKSDPVGGLFDHTASFVLNPASREIDLISTIPSSISGTSSSNNSLTISA